MHLFDRSNFPVIVALISETTLKIAEPSFESELSFWTTYTLQLFIGIATLIYLSIKIKQRLKDKDL